MAEEVKFEFDADMLKDMQPGEGPTKCTWTLGGNNGPSPHSCRKTQPTTGILDSILDHIGWTPMVRLNRIPQSMGIEAEILVKCEFFNAGGSVKDRIGLRMIQDAEEQGRIQPGDVLIEPTSGNTGIGLALTAAIKGYKMHITLPEKMSAEKVDVLKALGAEIHRTPTEAAWDSPDSHIGVANRLNKELPRSHILDQYANPSNPLAHYDGTAEEILAQCEGKVDAIVAGAGTGGTISGIARKIKEKSPSTVIVAVDPKGSILALPENLNQGGVGTYQVEGIGYDFIPDVLDRKLIDHWVKTDDKEAFEMARRLIREEGLLCGGSSGTAMVAALKIAKNFKKGQRIVVILPDSVRNYMSKFLRDDWMIAHGFQQPGKKPVQWWHEKPVSVIKLSQPVSVGPLATVQEALNLMKEGGYDQLPVLRGDGTVRGTVTLGNLSAKVTSGAAKLTDSVATVMYAQVRVIKNDDTLAHLSDMLDRDAFTLVVDEKEVVTGVMTRIDLVHYIAAHAPEHAANEQ